ncbi:hypothetical protein Tco_0543110 [Tanacetum coccineum]
MAIEESKNLSSLALDELIENLKVLEVVMEKDFKIYRGQKERVKSIALKAKKESSDDETLTSGSDDEEYAMAVTNFKRFFRRKGKFVRQPREEKKSFRQRDEEKGKQGEEGKGQNFKPGQIVLEACDAIDEGRSIGVERLKVWNSAMLNGFHVNNEYGKIWASPQSPSPIESDEVPLCPQLVTSKDCSVSLTEHLNFKSGASRFNTARQHVYLVIDSYMKHMEHRDSMNYIHVSLQNQANPAGLKEVIDIDVQTEVDADLMVVSILHLFWKRCFKEDHPQAAIFLPQYPNDDEMPKLWICDKSSEDEVDVPTNYTPLGFSMLILKVKSCQPKKSIIYESKTTLSFCLLFILNLNHGKFSKALDRLDAGLLKLCKEELLQVQVSTSMGFWFDLPLVLRSMSQTLVFVDPVHPSKVVNRWSKPLYGFALAPEIGYKSSRTADITHMETKLPLTKDEKLFCVDCSLSAVASTREDGSLEISATVDTKRYIISEASIRDSLQLDDATGISIFLYTSWRYWVPSSFALYKLLSGGMGSIGSNIATALICLSYGQTVCSSFNPPIPPPLPIPSPTPTPSQHSTSPPPIYSIHLLRQLFHQPTPPPLFLILHHTTPPETEPPTDEHIYEEQSPVHHHFSPSHCSGSNQSNTLGYAIVKLVKKLRLLRRVSKEEEFRKKVQEKKRVNRHEYVVSSLELFNEDNTVLKGYAASIEDKERRGKLLCSVKKLQRDKGTDLQEEDSLEIANKIGFLQREEELSIIHLVALLAQGLQKKEELTGTEKKRKSSCTI